MFSFVIWDRLERSAFAARDRFGVKPLYWHRSGGQLFLASEIKALHASGVPARLDEASWATWLATGRHDENEHTFWEGISQLRPGSWLRWNDSYLTMGRWYDFGERWESLEDLRVRCGGRGGVPSA